MKRCLLICLCLLALPFAAAAQIFTQGSDPGNLRWWRIDTPNYRIIYPEGTDSLARIYAMDLERLREATGRSIGMVPGESRWKKRTPVILHTHSDFSNGSMFCAPYRMDLFTRPEPYGGDPTPWEFSLTAHEPRHLAQLQAGYRSLWKPLNYAFGELVPAAVWSLYAGQPLSEGDAVAFETAVVGGSRARTAQFLNYFRVAFDEGDWRDWYRWRYGSYRDFAPDYYKVGYMTVAGMRYFYDDPLFMKAYYDRTTARPWTVGAMQKAVRRVTGKSFKASFREISEGFHAIWQEQAAARGPFMPMERISDSGSFHTDFIHSLVAGDSLFVRREGKVHAPEILLIENGKQTRICSFAESTSSLFWDPVKQRIYWSETVSDPRWTLAQTSRIRYMSVQDFKKKDLTRTGRLYNPEPSPDGSFLSVVEYPFEGGAAVLLISTEDGSVLKRYPVPDGQQPTESAWDDNKLYVSSISDGGYGLYRIHEDGTWEMCLPPAAALMQNLGNGEGFIEFVSDRDGADELYRYETGTGRLSRVTSARYGSTDFSEKDGYLYFSSQTRDGMALFRTPLDSLREVPVRYKEVRPTPIEDTLAAQEKNLAGGGAIAGPRNPSLLSAPRHYRKALNLLHFHSWAPVWFNIDNIMEASFDIDYKTASLGLTGLFQNQLGTADGYVGYSAHKDPYNPESWRHSFHGKMTYTGLYPVFEFSFDVNDRNTLRYGIRRDVPGEERVLTGRVGNQMQAGVSLLAYVPLVFNKGGILQGIIPQVRWTGSNDCYNSGETLFSVSRAFSNLPGRRRFVGIEPGASFFSHTIRASVRGYRMLPTPEACVYPRLGIGAETGVVFRPGLGDVFSPTGYGYVYGYLPGLSREQGLKLTAILERSLSDNGRINHTIASIAPRGFETAAGLQLSKHAPVQVKFTADYAIPFSFGDISAFAPVLYIKNFLLIPHVDYAFSAAGNLYAAGTDLTAELGGLAWIPFDTSVGITVDYKGGSLFDATGENHVSAALLFNIDF